MYSKRRCKSKSIENGKIDDDIKQNPMFDNKADNYDAGIDIIAVFKRQNSGNNKSVRSLALKIRFHTIKPLLYFSAMILLQTISFKNLLV